MNVDFGLIDDIADSPLSALDLDDMDRLVRLQSAKADLVAQRDALAARKAELEAATARLRTTLAHYARQQQRHDTRARLDFYLRQNDEQIQLAAPDTAAAFVVDNAGVLPSKDWPRRLEMAARFCPVEISHSSVHAVHTEEGLQSERRFALTAPGVPRVDVCMRVSNDAVASLAIENWAAVQAALGPVCADVAAFWGGNAVPRRKIDSLVASYAALARAQAERHDALVRMVRLYRAHVVRPAPEVVRSGELGPASLASLPYAEWEFSGASVRLLWRLSLESVATAAILLHTSFIAVRADGSVLPADAVFQRLLPEYGVVEAFQLMVRNMFGVEPDS